MEDERQELKDERYLEIKLEAIKWLNDVDKTLFLDGEDILTLFALHIENKNTDKQTQLKEEKIKA